MKARGKMMLKYLSYFCNIFYQQYFVWKINSQKKKHGFGVETWPDNARYEGEYLNG